MDAILKRYLKNPSQCTNLEIEVAFNIVDDSSNLEVSITDNAGGFHQNILPILKNIFR